MFIMFTIAYLTVCVSVTHPPPINHAYSTTRNCDVAQDICDAMPATMHKMSVAKKTSIGRESMSYIVQDTVHVYKTRNASRATMDSHSVSNYVNL